MANLPVPPGWKPSTKAEALMWLSNLEIQLGTLISTLEADSDQAARVYVALQIIAKIETLVNEL